MNEEIVKIRKDIDIVDKKIVKLLNERLELVLKIGNIKKRESIKIYDKTREDEILKKVKKYRKKVPDDKLEEIFKSIISCCREVEDS